MIDLEKYNTSEYTIEKQMPQENNGVYTQKVYVYKGGGHPVDQGEIVLTEEEVLALLPVQPKKYPVDLQALTADVVGTPFFNQLNEYYKASPALTIYLGDGVLTETEVPKLLAQLQIDLGEQRLSQELYDLIIERINNVTGGNNEG